MYMGSHFALAHSAAMENAEYGAGFALKDSKGRFFCGYRQSDGTLAHARFRQAHGSLSEVENSVYATNEPVFLNAEDMAAQAVKAAVFGTMAYACLESGIQSDTLKDCRLVFVRKDSTHCPIDRNPLDRPLSGPGLASVRACRAGVDKGYVSLKREFDEALVKFGKTVKSFLGLSGTAPKP